MQQGKVGHVSLPYQTFELGSTSKYVADTVKSGPIDNTVLPGGVDSPKRLVSLNADQNEAVCVGQLFLWMNRV